jgi:hypothetical protein
MRRCFIVLPLLLAVHGQANAAADLTYTPNDLPPVIEDTTKAADCVVTYLVTDISTNDMIAVRMRISPAESDKPVNNLLPCPRDIPPRLGSRALDVCAIRAADPKTCVFADMGRDFEKHPTASNTAENMSRCASDAASDIGVACWRAGNLDVCSAGCGDSPATAIAAAVSRCEAKQQRQCSITGSLPVLAPK